MIGIDMKMPRTCGECILGKKITSQYFACPVLDKAIPTGHKSPNCPLHPLDEEIRVGDEVSSMTGLGVITYINGTSEVSVVWSDGSCGTRPFDKFLKSFSKTGRHFDEVETLLQKMRGEDDA